MNDPERYHSPDLGELFAEFPPSDDLPEFERIAPDEVPEPYHTLLVHEHHMTVTLEAHHGAPVAVHILARRHDGDRYARKIVLTPEGSNRIVLFGIVRINLGLCSPAVRDQIVAGQTPLGRILIEHDVLRRIEISTYLRIQPGPRQLAWFGLTESMPFYGRLGFIHCDGKPAVELLEIVVPE
jgi:chorismate-pyruvate lyase